MQRAKERHRWPGVEEGEGMVTWYWDFIDRCLRPRPSLRPTCYQVYKDLRLQAEECCSVCCDGGTLMVCDGKKCGDSFYHVACSGHSQVPLGKWLCPECR